MSDETIEQLIKTEMTPKTITQWGQEIHSHTPTLIDEIHGDGLCLIWVCPLATRPDYYIIRADSSVKKMIEDDEDEIRDLLETEIYRMIRGEYGNYDDHEDYSENGTMLDFPALNLSCGCGWGEVA